MFPSAIVQMRSLSYMGYQALECGEARLEMCQEKLRVELTVSLQVPEDLAGASLVGSYLMDRKLIPEVR